MHLRGLTAVATTAATLLVLASPAAEAQDHRRSSARPDQQTVFVTRDETGRTRTKIIVQKRSYLDGGTEILPGQRHFMDYVIPPYYSPLETALGPGKNFDRQPLNPQWESGWPRMWFP